MTRLDIPCLSASEGDFKDTLDKKLETEVGVDLGVQKQVTDIISEVKRDGDDALVRFTNQFDGRRVRSVSELDIPRSQWLQALDTISSEERQSLEVAAERVKSYHVKQKQDSWQYKDELGNLLGQQVTPIEKVGVYVPGGKAAYPSSVLMNTIPAIVAGVGQIIMVVPAPGGEVNPLVLAAAATAKVDRVITVGGAQAVAGLAYGTETITPVDKIVGPGNMYVAEAKRQVFGKVGIDMIAGPSEILVICDGKTSPDWIAMDLFSQAEHDERAQSILISPDFEFLERVKSSMEVLLPGQKRAAVIRRSINDRGVFIHVEDIAEAIKWSNYIAPEHLELSIDDAQSWLPKISNAGAIFVGRYTPEAFGDYCAGPNHVLPTSGTARFSSPLGVYDFQKKSSIIHCSSQGAQMLSSVAATLASGEGLQAHADSARYRSKPAKA